MKIILLCWRDTTHPQGGGSERYLEHVAEYLAGQGHEVVFRTARHKKAPRSELRRGVKYVRGGAKFTVYPSAWLWMLRQRGVDAVVDTHNGIPFFAGLFTSAPTFVLNHHCHKEQWPVAGRVLGTFGWFLESRVVPWVYRNKQWVTVSEASRLDLRALGAHGVKIIENGVDPVPEFAPLKREAATHLVTLSRLVPHKQIEHAVDVVAQLDNCVLDVIGDGWWADELRAYVVRKGVTGRVRLHGQVSEERKAALLDRADVHLMPSRKEGWGLAVMEAAQHGVPTVGYTFGLRDAVKDGETGVLVARKEDLARATARVIASPEKLGENARRFAAQFSWEQTGKRWHTLIQEQTTTRAKTTARSVLARMFPRR